MTVSIFRESYPRELFEKLKNMGATVQEYKPGIYYISGEKVLFATQIVVIRKLDKKAHCTLRILSKNAQEDDVKEFLEEAMQMVEQGDRNNIDAVLQVSVSANQKLYEMIRRSDKIMCEALKELMKEDFEKKSRRHCLTQSGT